MARLRGNVVRATWSGVAFVFAALVAASAAEPQGRPGVVRFGTNQCFQTTDTSDFLDKGREIPCDDRYKDAEDIAWWEFLFKTRLKLENSPGNRANWEAWQASAASGATTLPARMAADSAERRKQAEQHADLSKPFLHGTCQPYDEEEKNNKEALERACKFDETTFQRDYWLALQGDHFAQEHVAYCFEVPGPDAGARYQRPCHDMVEPNATMMCAWYLVAASSGHPESAKSAEKYGFWYECDKQPLYERQAILGTATELFQRIYHRPMPVAR